MTSHSDTYQTIRDVLERLEQQTNLYAEEHFVERMQALDLLEIQREEELDEAAGFLTNAERLSFIQRNESIASKLNQANDNLFERLLDRIRSKDYAAVVRYFRNVEQQVYGGTRIDFEGYDELDMLANGLLAVPVDPVEPDSREAEMMFYQPTPVRVILRLIDELKPSADDVFYDLGSGIGHVPILFNLLTGIRVKGVELEESYIRFSEACLQKLGLSGVTFVQADARAADYSDGTIFYMYTPFRGELMEQVLTTLEAQSKQRPIRVCAYGPCTLQVSKAKWLRSITQTGKRETHYGLFSSI